MTQLSFRSLPEQGEYSGSRNEAGMKHGYGRIKFPSGATYDGGFIDDEKVKGTYTYASGNVYVGTWRNNMKHGKGKFVSVEHGSYEGEFYNDKAHGAGKFTFPDGTVYEGPFKSGEMHGQGIETDPFGNVFRGEFENGKKQQQQQQQQKSLRGQREAAASSKAAAKAKATAAAAAGARRRGVSAEYSGEWRDNEFVRGSFTSTSGDKCEFEFGVVSSPVDGVC
jgi:hypothetical protein